MLNLTVNGARVSYDSLDEAKDAACESGLGLAFWRETFTECAENKAMWNEFLNDLWQSGAEDEAERLDRTFPKDAPRHWLLVALTLDGDDPWEAFLAEWKAQGDERILSVVNNHAFAPWLKQVQPMKHDWLFRVFGVDTVNWPNDLLLKVLKSEDSEVGEWQKLDEQSPVVSATSVFSITDSLLFPKRILPLQLCDLLLGSKLGGERTLTLPGGVPMTFCWCPATTSEAWKKISGGDDFFWMGSPESEVERWDNEIRHRVKLTQGFWMGKYEVTQRQWRAVMGSNPSCFKGEDRPVEEVSWDDCQAFVGRINATGQVRVSLPTEAQWEFACRAGTMTPFNFGSTLNGDKANCNGDYPYGTMAKGRCRGGTAPVGSNAPNAWGLYDMHGNVWEWCADWHGDYSGDTTDPTGPTSGTNRVIRGGCWGGLAQLCRSAHRDRHWPSFRYNDLGFRLVCSAGLRR